MSGGASIKKTMGCHPVPPALHDTYAHLPGEAPMAVTSRREPALQVALVVLGLLTAGANIYPLVTSLQALRPTGLPHAPPALAHLSTLRGFLVAAFAHP